MKRILLPALASVLCLLSSALCSPASPFYTYTIAARTGVDLDGSGFVVSSISPRVSLNDSGAVAFIAENLDPVSMNDSGTVALLGQIFLDDGFGRLALQIPQSAFCN